MSVEQDLNQLLKQAMYAKDQRTADCVRMIKTKLAERRTAPGFKGEVTDDITREVIASYQKQLRKALEEYQAAGERAAPMREQLAWEIQFCDRFLPQKMGEAEVRGLVRAAIEALGAKDPKQSGRVVGEVMKAHRDKVDAALVKRVAEQELSGGKA
jgi:uncharacterized protein YqeY